jgi:hypothetical protein
VADELIPITDEQAKAIQESAKLGQEALGVLKSLGGYLREILGTVPEDFVGLIGGDWLRLRRAENMAEIAAKARERLRVRGVKNAEPISLTLALPLLRAASDESRDELQALWARLLASAMDPKRARMVRREFIETIIRFAPIDAIIMKRLYNEAPEAPGHQNIAGWARHYGVTELELTVALDNLRRLECIQGYQPFTSGPDAGKLQSAVITPYGRELMRACAD